MKKYLEEFYHGNIRPNEGSFPRDPAYKQIGEKICQLEASFLADLDEEKKGIYEKLQFACIDRGACEDGQLFADTFRLGARLMLEVMLEDGGDK